MSRCTIADLTVDAETHGNVMKIQHNSDMMFTTTGFRKPVVDAIYCNNCGEYLFEGGAPQSIDEAVKEHLGVTNGQLH